MAQATGQVSLATLNNRRLAAKAILLGYDDPDVSTVLTNAATYKKNASVTSYAHGGIIGSVNR